MAHADVWEHRLLEYLKTHNAEHPADSAHDISHLKRVLGNALRIGTFEGVYCDRTALTAAALLHDLVCLPKNHPDRHLASALSADKATDLLKEMGFPLSSLVVTYDAIRSHSFSAGIAPVSVTAKILQDADRLDALGAVGIARCFAVGGSINRPLFHPDDPFILQRKPDDLAWTLDHFYVKLFKLPSLMHTTTGRQMAERRVAYMRGFLEHLNAEL